MGVHLIALSTALWLLAGAKAARVCGTAPSSFPWRVGDVRFDGADPRNNNSYATVAASISPAPRGTLFECVAKWPEPWAGWYEGTNEIIWSDCIWTGNGGTVDRTISFAYDWNNQTFYLSHTFDCSDEDGSIALALGSVDVELNCTTVDDIRTCDLSNRAGINLTATEVPSRTDPGIGCADNADRYHSWEITRWNRQYELPPGSNGPPLNDTGPSFTLNNVGNANVFSCVTSGRDNEVFEGSCTLPTDDPTTTAEFRFNRDTNMLTVTQHWSCDETSTFDAQGIGYVQSRCDRKGNMLTCDLEPVWVGTQTPDAVTA